MQFAPSPARDPAPHPDRPLWRRILLGSAAIGAACATQPWIRVRFAALFTPFSELFGPPAWHSSAGFTCLCTCALVAIITLAETGSRQSQSAVRPASLMLVVLMAASVVLHAGQGPGSLRGVSACWTSSFYAGGAAVAALIAACAMRCAAMGGRGAAPRSAWPGS